MRRAFFRPGDQGAVAAHLIVLDGLRIREDRSIKHGFIFDLAGSLVGFPDDAVREFRGVDHSFATGKLCHIVAMFFQGSLNFRRFKR